MFASMIQSFHALGNAVMNTRCTSSNWANQVKFVQNIASGSAGSPDPTLLGTFALAFNTENLCFKSKSFTTGTNSLTSPVIINASVYPASVTVALAVSTIVHYDCVVEFSEQGVALRC